MALDAVEPGSLRRREVEPDVVCRSPCADLGLQVRPVIVHNHMQDLVTRIPPADPLEEGQELNPRLATRELPEELVGLQVVDGKEMTHTALPLVCRPQTVHRLARSRQAMPVTRLQVQRTELVDAQPSAKAGPLPIQVADSTGFPPEKRIGRFLPGLGPAQANLAPMQKLT